MKSQWILGMLLVSVVGLGSGATVDGVRQARDWQQAGDTARLFDQPAAAYSFYEKVAESFPGTPYGRYAAKRARASRARLRKPAAIRSMGDPVIVELLDFLTW